MQEFVWSPGVQIAGGCEPSDEGVGNQSPVLLQDQQAFLIMEPSLQLPGPLCS